MQQLDGTDFDLTTPAGRLGFIKALFWNGLPYGAGRRVPLAQNDLNNPASANNPLAQGKIKDFTYTTDPAAPGVRSVVITNMAPFEAQLILYADDLPAGSAEAAAPAGAAAIALLNSLKNEFAGGPAAGPPPGGPVRDPVRAAAWAWFKTNANSGLEDNDALEARFDIAYAARHAGQAFSDWYPAAYPDDYARGQEYKAAKAWFPRNPGETMGQNLIRFRQQWPLYRTDVPAPGGQSFEDWWRAAHP